MLTTESLGVVSETLERNLELANDSYHKKNRGVSTLDEFYKLVSDCTRAESSANFRLYLLKANLSLYDNKEENFLADKEKIMLAIIQGYPDRFLFKSMPNLITPLELIDLYGAQKKKHSEENGKKSTKHKGYVDNRSPDFEEMGIVLRMFDKKVKATFTRYMNLLFPETNSSTSLQTTSAATPETDSAVAPDTDIEQSVSNLDLNSTGQFPSTPNDTPSSEIVVRHSDRINNKRPREEDNSNTVKEDATKNVKKAKSKSKPVLVRREIFDLTSEDIDEVLILKDASKKNVLKKLAVGLAKSTNAYSVEEHLDEYLECPENKKAAYKKYCAKFFRDEKKEKKD
jgi:hypothetical protein